MKSLKTIEHIITPPPPHMVGDGFRVHSFFPGGRLIDKKRMSPFFLLDYGAKIDFSPSPEPRGVGVHPHAGFETVTIAYHGKIAHHDSAGNHGIIGEGDVQWMTAGSGLLHKEYHEEGFSKTGGLFQMVQLWVNLPAAYKKTNPKYQEITHQQMGRHILDDGQSFIEVIAGAYKETQGPAFTFSPMQVYNARLQQNAISDLTFPAHYNTGMLVIEGNMEINGSMVATDHFVLFRNEGEEIQIKATENSIVLVLSGEPINEPIAAYGPFLMNTWPEVEQAIRDANAGKFGNLE
ncbi:MAG: pirin family protein [Chitinophagaceae bacterium]|nr:pirin family protein [Chitinophagaceae bacterium]